ncbi:MAG: carbohydrate kinase family protein [Anaerolineae bacterium]
MRDYDILVIGELNVDLILTGEDVVPEFGQVEKLVDDATLALGSSSAIFACGASRLGLRVAFAGKVGDDDFGRFMLRTLQERGVDTTPVMVDSAVKTGLTVHLSRSDDRAMLTYPGSIAAFRATEVDQGLFARTRHVHLSSFFLQTSIRPDLAGLFEAARDTGATVSLDPGWDPAEDWNGTLRQVLTQVDVFLPNAQEAVHIAQTADPSATLSTSLGSALDDLAQRLPLVVVKLGAEGAMARRAGDEVHCPTFNVVVINTTGAGDSFNAGFLRAYLHERDLVTCLRWGCACGALATTKVGGIAGQPTVTEVEALLSSS